MCILGVSMMNNYIYGFKVPQNTHFGGLNRHFKPNMRKIQIAISWDLCIRLTWNLTGSCGQQQRLRGWSRMVVKRPPFWKSTYRHISVKWWNFVHSSRFWTGWTSRDRKWKTCIGQTPNSTERISCFYFCSVSVRFLKNMRLVRFGSKTRFGSDIIVT